MRKEKRMPIEEIENGEKLHQLGAEMRFTIVVGFVPWRHHVEIVNRYKWSKKHYIYMSAA